MALAKKCDRCGKLYEHYPDEIRRWHLLSDDKILDLCHECMKAFNEFMIGGRLGR